jgi:hypothetical protein
MRRIFTICLLGLCLQSCFQRARNCEAFKTGKFSFTYTLNGKKYTDTFTRNDSLEITYSNSVKDTSSIRWINDCEFIVKKLNPVSVAEKKSDSY